MFGFLKNRLSDILESFYNFWGKERSIFWQMENSLLIDESCLTFLLISLSLIDTIQDN